MRLYGGKFRGGQKGLAEFREWASKQKVGAGPFGVYSGTEIATVVVELDKSKTYRDHETLMTVKVLLEAGLIAELDPAPEPARTLDRPPSQHAPVQQVIATLPIGSKVISTKYGLQGVVLGHKQDSGKATYVLLWVDGEDKYYLPAAST